MRLKLHLEGAQLRSHQLGFEFRGMQLALLKFAVIAEARLDPQHAPIGDDVFVEARHHQQWEARSGRNASVWLKHAQLNKDHRLQRDSTVEKVMLGQQVQRHARAPRPPFDGPPPSELEYNGVSAAMSRCPPSTAPSISRHCVGSCQ